MTRLFLSSILLSALINSSCVSNNDKSCSDCEIEKTKKTVARDLTAQTIIKNSINFHDPKGNWNSLNAQFKFESSFSWNDSVPEELQIDINVPENGFRYHNLDRKVDISYLKDSCFVHSKEGNCGGYSWTKNFYTYVWGLPMKLNDPGISPEETFATVQIDGKNLYEVEVHYPAENFKFYFDQENYQLSHFSFLKNDSSGKGEFIILKGLFEYNGIKFPAHKTWTHLNDTSLIGTNEVKSITSL